MIKSHYLAGLVLAFFIAFINPVTVNAEEVVSEEYAEIIYQQFLEQFQAQYEAQLAEQIAIELGEIAANEESTALEERSQLLYSPTQEERDIAARVIFAEAGNQGYYGMYLVAETIVNRALSPLYPNTVKEICFQPCQYTTINKGVTDECYQAFDEACRHLDHPITHFCSGGVWPAYGYRVLEYGVHRFTSHL